MTSLARHIDQDEWDQRSARHPDGPNHPTRDGIPCPECQLQEIMQHYLGRRDHVLATVPLNLHEAEEIQTLIAREQDALDEYHRGHRFQGVGLIMVHLAGRRADITRTARARDHAQLNDKLLHWEKWRSTEGRVTFLTGCGITQDNALNLTPDRASFLRAAQQGYAVCPDCLLAAQPQRQHPAAGKPA